MKRKPKILIMPDVAGWAYEIITDNIIRLLSHKYDFSKQYANDVWDIDDSLYDLVFSMGWLHIKKGISFDNAIPKNISKNKHISVIHSSRTLESFIDLSKVIKYIKKVYIAIGVVNRELYGMFEGGIKNIYLTENGVDTELFRPSENRNNSFKIVVGWTGRGKQDTFRGLPLILNAADICSERIELKMLDADKDQVSHSKMPEFYNGLDFYINASESEGFSLPVAEAAACGIPPIATRAGVARELITDGVTGHFIDRSTESIVDVFNKLSKQGSAIMGNAICEKVRSEYSWDVTIKHWDKLIRRGLNG